MKSTLQKQKYKFIKPNIMFTAKLVVVPKTKQNKTWQYIQQIK